MRNGLCECGCGEKTNLAPQTHTRDGWVKGEPMRFIRGHYARTIQKFPRTFHEDPATHCWLWKGLLWSNGYARVNQQQAHRLYYEDLVGPIPVGLQIDHLCRNRACVNPGHLEPVTQRVNILRGAGIPAENARKTHCKRGHPLSGPNLYVRPSDTSRTCRACTRERWTVTA